MPFAGRFSAKPCAIALKFSGVSNSGQTFMPTNFRLFQLVELPIALCPILRSFASISAPSWWVRIFPVCSVGFFTCDGNFDSNETESFQYSVTRIYFYFLEPSKIEMRLISVYFPYLNRYFLSQKEIKNCDSSSLSSFAILMHFPDPRREKIPKIVVIETCLAEFRLIYGQNGCIQTQ